MLCEIDVDSTPGYCVLTNLGSTNGQILGWNGITFDPDRVSLVRSQVRLRFDALLRGERIRDPIKVFIKQEAHSYKKLRDERYRLISAVSFIDTCIDRILFAWLARIQLDTVGETPCMVGWTPMRGGWRLIQDRFKNNPVNCLDKAAWDWTVHGYMVDLWREFFKHLPVNAANWWHGMVELRLSLLFDDPIYRFEDGTVVQQPVRGVMKSGCYLTILLNSLSQSFVHYIANARCGKPMMLNQPINLGDDTVQDALMWLQPYVAHVEALGIEIKGAKVQHWVEFAGFCYTGRTCFPAYWEKHLYNLSHSENLEETLKSYQILYVNEPVMYDFICRVAKEVSATCLIPTIEALAIMNHSG